MATESQVVPYRHRASVPRHQGPNPKPRIRGRRNQQKIRSVSIGQAYTTVGRHAEWLDQKMGHPVQLKVAGEAEEEVPLDVESDGPVGLAHGFEGMETSASNPDDLEMRSSVSHRGWDRSSDGGADDSERGLGVRVGVEVGVEAEPNCFGRFGVGEVDFDSDGLLGPLAGLDLLRSEGAEDSFDGFEGLSGLRGFGRPAAETTEPSLNGGGGGEFRDGVDISGRREDSRR
ncbi:UNVERIFIED_CONTAM: hypothetical protein K2H54_025581 [Gekko kuhli]